MASVFREVVVDSVDPIRVGTFWSEVLGWPLVRESDSICWISSTGKPDAPPPLLVFVQVPEAKHGKNRVHVDVNPSGCDQDEEMERLLRLGAKHVDVGQGDMPWIVLADPEGNEFCLLGRRID